MLLYCRKQCVVGCFSRHNKLHAKYLSACCCLWLCRPTADTCNPAQWKQAWDGGWMTDTHYSWHPRTQTLKGDWQGFAHESGENESVACNDMSCGPASQTRACPIPIFNSQRGQRWRHLCHCPSALKQRRYYGTVPNSLHWITHTPQCNSQLIFD